MTDSVEPDAFVGQHLVLAHLVDGSCVVFHRLTWEAALLDSGRAPWSLSADAEGLRLLTDNEGRSKDVSEVLAKRVVCRDGEHLVLGGSRSISLVAFRSAHVAQYFRLEVPLLPEYRTIEPIDAKLICLANGADGAKAMWELRRLQRYLFPDSDFYQSAQWPHNKWQRLAQMVGLLSIPEAHLQRPRATQQSKAGSAHGVSDDFTLSTYALVAALVRWIGVAKSDEEAGAHSLKNKALSLLARLIVRFLGADIVEVHLSLDADAVCLPSICVCGGNLLKVMIVNGCLDLEGLLHSRLISMDVRREMATLEVNGRAPLWLLFEAWSARLCQVFCT